MYGPRMGLFISKWPVARKGTPLLELEVQMEGNLQEKTSFSHKQTTSTGGLIIVQK